MFLCIYHFHYRAQKDNNYYHLYKEYFDLPVELFDPNREQINISATKLRESPKEYKAYLLDNVYPYFFE